MIVKIPDDIYLQFGSDEAITKFLQKFNDLNIAESLIILTKAQRVKLQGLFDSVIPNGYELVKLVEKLAQLKIGTLTFNFTPEQMGRLKEMADFNNKSLKDFIAELVQNNINEWLSTV